MAGRSLFALASLFFTAGALLLMLLIFLAGAINHGPMNKFYLLEAATKNIPGAFAESRWTFWNLCSVADGRNKCGHVHPAFPLNPPSTHGGFGTTKHVPKQFIGTSKFFYLTRFMFAFELMALFFAACALMTGVLALCTRIASYLSGFFAFLALFFQTLAAALMTSAYVIGRDAFRSNGQAASIGEYAFGFEWAAWACLLIATALFCTGGKSGSKKNDISYSSNRRSFFGGKRSKSTKSKHSTFDSNKEYGV